MSRCPSKISDAELNNFENNLEELVYECLRTGCTRSEVLMDSLNIMKQDDHIVRDELVLCRQPPIILAHDAT